MYITLVQKVKEELMKRSRFFKSFVLSTIVVAVCAFQSMAAVHSISFGVNGYEPLTYLSVSQGGLNDPNNPNHFSVYYVESSVHSVNRFGFLLDGSEWSNMLVKRFSGVFLSGPGVLFSFYY